MNVEYVSKKNTSISLADCESAGTGISLDESDSSHKNIVLRVSEESQIGICDHRDGSIRKAKRVV